MLVTIDAFTQGMDVRLHARGSQNGKRIDEPFPRLSVTSFAGSLIDVQRPGSFVGGGLVSHRLQRREPGTKNPTAEHGHGHRRELRCTRRLDLGHFRPGIWFRVRRRPWNIGRRRHAGRGE
jgi:hypothetical protein